MASIDLYTKQQIDAKIPDTSGASSGDVLTFNGSANVWQAPSSSGVSKHTYSTVGELITDIKAHINDIVAIKGKITSNNIQHLIDVNVTGTSSSIATGSVAFNFITGFDISGGTSLRYLIGVCSTYTSSSSATSITFTTYYTVFDTSGNSTTYNGDVNLAISNIAVYY